jgi:hypothetical protein
VGTNGESQLSSTALGTSLVATKNGACSTVQMIIEIMESKSNYPM